MRTEGMPAIPYGAVYFRKSNPPREDWERDYAQAAADGMNAFRHWFLWSAIEVAPGVYDWDDYDRQLDLAAEHGLKTIIADILATAPQWTFREYPHARVEAQDGTPQAGHYTPACAVGGWPGLCLDNEDVRTHAEAFLQALVERYRGHPGLGGYDVWNELNHLGDAGGCWCEASADKFRQWLADKYGDVETLGKAWYRYSYRDWDDVQIPRTTGPYPDSIDWALFRIDNAVRLLEWRVGVIRSLDSEHPVTAHAIPMGCIRSLGAASYPVFEAGRLVDVYGYSGGCNHEEPTRLRWQHWCKMDMTRSASYGKPFWAAEMPAGASWRMRGTEMAEGRLVTPSDVRLYTLMHFAGGARGVFSPRWRPLQDGPFMGSFAFYGMDGSPTDRSQAGSEMARWANAPGNADLWDATPVPGDIGILVVPESQIHCYVSENSTEFYYRSVTGAYQAFLFSNIQPDFVFAADPWHEHDLLYLPYPLMLTEALVDKLKEWVGAGGCLVSEGCPAYFGDGGRAGTGQPAYGLDELFGAREDCVQFTPDLLDDLHVKMGDGARLRGGVFAQSYAPTTGAPVGTYDDGRVAAVDNTYGKGRTRLIGTFPGFGYAGSHDDGTRRFFAGLLPWAGKVQHVTSTDPRVIARLQMGRDSIFLWAINPGREDVRADLTLSEQWGPFEGCESFWGGEPGVCEGRTISVSVPARDGLVLRLF